MSQRLKPLTQRLDSLSWNLQAHIESGKKEWAPVLRPSHACLAMCPHTVINIIKIIAQSPRPLVLYLYWVSPNHGIPSRTVPSRQAPISTPATHSAAAPGSHSILNPFGPDDNQALLHTHTPNLRSPDRGMVTPPQLLGPEPTMGWRKF